MLATLKPDGTLQVEQENLSKLGWLIEQLHETAGIPGMLGHHTLGVYVMGVVSGLIFFGANDRFNHPLADVGQRLFCDTAR